MTVPTERSITNQPPGGAWLLLRGKRFSIRVRAGYEQCNEGSKGQHETDSKPCDGVWLDEEIADVAAEIGFARAERDAKDIDQNPECEDGDEERGAEKFHHRNEKPWDRKGCTSRGLAESVAHAVAPGENENGSSRE